MKPLTGRELFFLILLVVTVFYPNKWIHTLDLIVFLVFFFNWKLIFQVTFLGYDPNTGKKRNPLEDVVLERTAKEALKQITKRRP